MILFTRLRRGDFAHHCLLATLLALPMSEGAAAPPKRSDSPPSRAAGASPALMGPSDDAPAGVAPHADPRYRAGLGLLNRGLHAEAATELAAFLADVTATADPIGTEAGTGTRTGAGPAASEPDGEATVATARYALAICYARLDRLADAARELDRIPAAAPFAHAADAAMLRAQCAIAVEHWDVAETTLAALLAAHPTFARQGVAQTMRGEALLRAGRHREARDVLAAAAREWTAPPLPPTSTPGTEPASASVSASAIAVAQWRDRCDLLCASAEAALGDDDAAVQRLAALRVRSPRSEFAAESALQEAQALQRLTRHAECLERCRVLLESAAQPDIHLQVRALQRRSLLALGDAALERGDHAAAESRFASLRPLCDGAELLDTLLRLGVSIQRQGRPGEAIPLYDELLEHSAEPALAAHAHFERGQALLELGSLDEARLALERALATDVESQAPFRAAARRQLFSLALREGRLSDASSLLGLAGTAADGGDAAPSAADIDLALELGTDLGAAWLSAGDPGRAERTFAALLQLGPSHHRHRQARLYRAMALGRLGRHDEALLEHAALADGGDGGDAVGNLDRGVLAAAHAELASSLLAVGRRTDAIAALHAALASDPSPTLQAHAAVELARLAVEDEQFPSALALLAQVDAAITAAILSAEKRDGEPSSNAAPSDTRAGEDPLAPLRDRANYLRAVAQLRSGDAGAAARSFALLRAAAGPSAPHGEQLALRRSALLLEAEALLASGDPAGALPLLDDLLADDSSELAAPALLRLGEAAAAVQHWVRSDQAFTRFLETFPTHELWFKARFGQGAAREAQGRFDAAIEAYRDVAARHQGPTAARAQFQVGECLFALKRLEDAVRELVKVDLLHASPEWSAAALTEAGRCLAELGRSGEARSQFDAVLQRFPESRWATLAAQQRDALAPATLPGRSARESPAASPAPARPASPAPSVAPAARESVAAPPASAAPRVPD